MPKKKAKSDFAYPSDLAEVVKLRLTEMRRRSPAESVLRMLFEVAFFASLKTEEAEPVHCALTYMSHKDPDPSPPERIVPDRWSVTRLAESIDLNVKNLVKVAKSVDPNAGSLAVYADEGGGLKIWGIVDQRVGREAFLSAESEEGPEPPGILEVLVTGIGAIEVYKDYTLVAALRQGHLSWVFQDVLHEGPVSEYFRDAIATLIQEVQAKVSLDVYKDRDHWDETISGYWTDALTRILLGVQSYGHGGAILVIPDANDTGLRIKHAMNYGRLTGALMNYAVWTIQRTQAEDKFHEHFLEKQADDMPVRLHLDEVVFRNEAEDTSDEITGCVRLIASLSRVDGLVVMNRDLSIRGYGGIITVQDEPPDVRLARDPSGRTSTRIRSSYFGTRHQSMMRMCYARQGAVGFVVSQDGDVRAMTRVGDRVLIWEDIKLRLV